MVIDASIWSQTDRINIEPRRQELAIISFFLLFIHLGLTSNSADERFNNAICFSTIKKRDFSLGRSVEWSSFQPSSSSSFFLPDVISSIIWGCFYSTPSTFWHADVVVAVAVIVDSCHVADIKVCEWSVNRSDSPSWILDVLWRPALKRFLVTSTGFVTGFDSLASLHSNLLLLLLLLLLPGRSIHFSRGIFSPS